MPTKNQVGNESQSLSARAATVAQEPLASDAAVRTALRSYILESFLFDPDAKLDDNTSLLQEGILDSTGVLDVVAHVEETFGIEVEDEELVPQNFDTVRSLCDYVKRKTAGRND